MDAVEVWNGAWTLDDDATVGKWDELLRAGERIVATGGSDAHRAPDVIGRPQTVVRANQLSDPAIINGIAAGRVYLTENQQVSLVFKVSDQGRTAEIGDTLRADKPKAKLRVKGAPGTIATLKTDRGAVATLNLEDDSTFKVNVAGARWVRAEVRRPDGAMVALTNPIWLR